MNAKETLYVPTFPVKPSFLKRVPVRANAVKLRIFMLQFEADCYASVRE